MKDIRLFIEKKYSSYWGPAVQVSLLLVCVGWMATAFMGWELYSSHGGELALAMLVSGAVFSVLLAAYVGHMMHKERRLLQDNKSLRVLIEQLKRAEEIQESIERDLRESEQQLSAVINSVADAIITADEHGRIEAVNEAAEDLFGYEAEEMGGRSLVDFTRESDRQIVALKLEDEIFASHEKGYRGVPLEVTGITKTGEEIALELTMSNLRQSSHGSVVYVLRDVTRKRHLERQAEQAQRMETIGQLSGGIAHDFNNMLLVMGGNLEMIGMKIRGDEKLEKMVTTASRAVSRARELTDRLLTFSRRQVLQPEPMDLGVQLPSMKDLMDRTLGDDMEVHINVADDLWQVCLDPGQLENALLNLAINARDAMKQGGHITFSAENFPLGEENDGVFAEFEPGDYVRLSVADTGEGIPTDLIGYVFDPFYTTKDVGKGTGMGLSMVYGFVTQSGGYINVYSQPGEGTVFKIYLPRFVSDQEGNRGDKERSFISYDDEDLPHGGETILVVDDDPEVLEYVSGVVEALGYKLLTASGGREAIDLVSSLKAPPDLLLSDVVMPGGLTGEQLAHDLAKLVPGLKVLFMSGYTREALTDRGRLKEGVELLSKPFARVEIAHKIRTVLDKKS